MVDGMETAGRPFANREFTHTIPIQTVDLAVVEVMAGLDR